MPQFVYKVRDGRGALGTGVLTADDISQATHTLRSDGKTIISLQAGLPTSGSEPLPLGGTKRIKHDDIIFFATQLAVMVDTGVPLIDALDSILAQTRHLGMKRMIEEVCGDVRGGVEFSAALEKHPKVFSTLFISLMRASEASGTMGKMLQRVSEYMEQQRETRQRIKGAMIYPLCMLAFCVDVVVCLLVFVLPRFEKIYAGKSAVLPAPTRVLMAMSHALTNYWPFIAGGLVVGAAALAFYLRSPAGRSMLDTVRIRMPILGKLCRKACLARSLRCMATMVSTGVSMLEGLAITAQVAGNRHYKDIWGRVADGVREGSTVSDQLCDCPLIPPSVAQMIDAGERSGKLGMVMDRVAKFCEDDLKVAVKTMTDLIEPVMIIIMGIIVGGIAMALLLPVFKISKVVAR